jgi:HTH-type transcriptional regulator / antitoxin HipB
MANTHRASTLNQIDDAERDDIEAYVSTFNEVEREALVAAESAIDIAILLNRARRQRGLTQKAAANLAGLQQQAISRFESPDVNPRLESVQAYLGALGFALELKVIDVQSGDVAATAVLPVKKSSESRRIETAAR